MTNNLPNIQKSKMIIRSPEPIQNKKSIFLAGSIEGGKARDWYQEVIPHINQDLVIYCPRREHWDDTFLIEQINWELDAIGNSHYVFFYFQGDTISPISLLELGLCLGKKEIVVSVDANYYRYTNIQETIKRFNLKVNSMGQAIDIMKQWK